MRVNAILNTPLADEHVADLAAVLLAHARRKGEIVQHRMGVVATSQRPKQEKYRLYELEQMASADSWAGALVDCRCGTSTIAINR